MDIIIITACILGIWLCLAHSSRTHNNSDISDDIDKKFK